jgi:GNAT superfamily N-acetyltransferase
MKNIQNITFRETFAVRHPVLREGKPLESCHFDGDDLTSTVHFGLFVDEKLIGVVSVFQNKNSIFNKENQFQIRGMAILPKYQKKGFGAKLVERCEEYILSKNGELIWFNARENALPFYQKLGYQIIGNPFVISDIGTHYIMKKNLLIAYE